MSTVTETKNLEQFVKENLENRTDTQGKRKALEGKILGELFQEIAKSKGKERIDVQDFEDRVKETEQYNLTPNERRILNDEIEQGRKEYTSLLQSSVDKKNTKDKASIDTLQAQIDERNILLQQFGSSTSESSEQPHEGASVEMKQSMIDRNTKMMNNGNGLNAEDMRSLENMPLSMTPGTPNIIELQGFGKMASTVGAKIEYRDMDKDNKRDINNLKSCEKFEYFAEGNNLEIMSLDDTYTLMNMIAKQFGIDTKIDQNYINDVYTKEGNKSLSDTHPLGRLLRALSVITGDWINIPFYVDGKLVRSLCYSGSYAGIYVNDIVSYGVAPLSKVASSSSA